MRITVTLSPDVLALRLRLGRCLTSFVALSAGHCLVAKQWWVYQRDTVLKADRMPNRCRPTVRQVLAFGTRLIERPGGGLTPWRSSSSQVAFCAESVSLACSTAEALLSWRYSGEQGGWNTSTMARFADEVSYLRGFRPSAARSA